MINEYVKLIKTLRSEKGISQLDISKKLGISRPSYIAIEQGKRELTLSEANILADLFGISLEEIKGGTLPNFKKYTQMILAYLRCTGSVDGKIPKTKLAKLLYLADFSWFYKNLKSMSGMPYRKIKFGPVPDVYFRVIDELSENGMIDITQTGEGAMLIASTRAGKKEALSELSGKEENLIKDIAAKWKGKRTKDIVEFTHKQLPYMICKDNEIIPYGLITQEDPDDVY